jgi:cold shock CspA family protein
MPTGKIKWFSTQIGTGFIRSDQGENIFFRFNAIHSDNPKALQRGQSVIFDVAKVLKGISLTASSVTLLDSGHEEGHDASTQ